MNEKLIKNVETVLEFIKTCNIPLDYISIDQEDKIPVRGFIDYTKFGEWGENQEDNLFELNCESFDEFKEEIKKFKLFLKKQYESMAKFFEVKE